MFRFISCLRKTGHFTPRSLRLALWLSTSSASLDVMPAGETVELGALVCDTLVNAEDAASLSFAISTDEVTITRQISTNFAKGRPGRPKQVPFKHKLKALAPMVDFDCSVIDTTDGFGQKWRAVDDPRREPDHKGCFRSCRVR